MAEEKDWFKTWFSTDYYDLLYQHRDKHEAACFIDALLGYLKPEATAAILDAGCGKGRHAVHLAHKGFDVTGIDLSFKNIRSAKQEEKENLTFFQHDMRKVFRVNFFDFIFNFYTSFGYYNREKDNLQIIESFAAGLKKGGILVIDFMNVIPLMNKEAETKNIIIRDIDFTVTKKYQDGFVVKEILVKQQDKTHLFVEKVKAITRTDFEDYLKQFHLHILNTFGDYSLQQFEESDSERLILVAQK